MTLDTQILYLLNAFVGLSPMVDGIITFLAQYLAYVLLALFFVLLLSWSYSKREKLEILCIVMLSGLIARFGVTELIRFFYHRPRPFVDLPVHHLQTIVETSWSFPSGHATFFFALSTAIYLFNKGWGRVFFALTVIMTLARVAAGVHYPSDIVGGALIGFVTAWLTYAVISRLLKQKAQ